MSSTIRIATFNCENLFSRTRIFKEIEPKASQLLQDVEKLTAELKKPVFDQVEIKRLGKALAGYVTINDIRLNHKTPGIGAGKWLGWLEFKTDPATDAAIQNLARVIADIDADIICLIEVETRTLLQKFHDDILYEKYLKPKGKKRYDHIMLIDGNDERGIDVSVMSRFPIQMLKSYIDDTTTYLDKTVRTFSRDCLHVQLDIKAEKPLNLFINHLKSQGYTGKGDPGGNIRREGQAKRVVEIIENLDLKGDYVIVAGDLNCDSSSPSLAPLLTNPDLYNLNLKLPPDERGTYLKTKQQLDYLIVTEQLKGKCMDISINRTGIFTAPGVNGMNNKTEAASDHAAVVADFEF